MLAISLCFIGMASAFAHGEGLNISPFLSEEYASRPSVTMVSMVSMGGKQTKWDGLTFYQSISVVDDMETADAIARAVRKDGTKAEFKTTSYKDGVLYFGFYGLGGEGKNRTYLFYLDKRPKGENKTVLVYVKGDWTPDEVKKMISKKIK